MKSKARTGLFAAAGMLFLILDAKAALAGAADAVRLCLTAVIPSLFPFFVLSILLTSSVSGQRFRFLRPLGKLIGVPDGAENIFLVGLLGGYPTGAQAVMQCRKSGSLDDLQAKRMLGFCSNAGPAFIFGLLSAKFPSIWMLWALWGIHIISAVAVGIILPGKSGAHCHSTAQPALTLPQAVYKAAAIMASVCGWIVIFRVFLTFLSRWILWILPAEAQIAVYGLTELANGCCSLELVRNVGMRFVLCSGLLGFGGLCVAMQTASVTGPFGLGWYFPGKFLQCIISILLASFTEMLFFSEADSWAVSPILLIFTVLFVAVLVLIMQRKKNKGSIPGTVGV